MPDLIGYDVAIPTIAIIEEDELSSFSENNTVISYEEYVDDESFENESEEPSEGDTESSDDTNE